MKQKTRRKIKNSKSISFQECPKIEPIPLDNSRSSPGAYVTSFSGEDIFFPSPLPEIETPPITYQIRREYAPVFAMNREYPSRGIAGSIVFQEFSIEKLEEALRDLRINMSNSPIVHLEHRNTNK